jgi:hypothetical protein
MAEIQDFDDGFTIADIRADVCKLKEPVVQLAATRNQLGNAKDEIAREENIFSIDDEDDGYEYERKGVAEEPHVYPPEGGDDICSGVRFYLIQMVSQGVSDERDKSDDDDESTPKEMAYCPAERNRTTHDTYRYKDDMNEHMNYASRGEYDSTAERNNQHITMLFRVQYQPSHAIQGYSENYY